MIAQYTVFEYAFYSPDTYENALWDVDLQVQFSAPSGKQTQVDAFWDGGDVWRVRFSPDEIGQWTWNTICSDEGNTGLHGHSGQFECSAYSGRNPLYLHGPLQVAEDHLSIVHADGTPFFWLADTPWNGVMRATTHDWERYLQHRHTQGFSAAQFVSTHWRGMSRDNLGEQAFIGTDRITLNVPFYHRLDPKVAALNEHGMIAAPVMIWAYMKEDPGQLLSEAAAIRLARYLQARWGAYQVVWLMAGDGCYKRDGMIEHWCRVGRAVFGDHHNRLVTMHPCGQYWVKEDFGSEPWFDFIGYQSGHGDSEKNLRWLVEGPPANDWNSDPLIPVINLEPNYETHPSYDSDTIFKAYEVRRASYWSLLISPPVGVTYGHNAIWMWAADQAEEAENHPTIGLVGTWDTALDTPGLDGMTLLRQFFDRLPWWTLRPAAQVLVTQPGVDDPRDFIAVAQSMDGQITVAYLPEGQTITLRTEALHDPERARWFNPRSGDWHDTTLVTLPEQTLTPPDTGDWLLVID
ncbi:MAG: DUF4038 domain-containing protein [Anaerolineae bacterium]|nr:DUF4038 domain-containing protein [Anaerolineae bacterium]